MKYCWLQRSLHGVGGLTCKVKKRRVNICRQKFLAIDPIYYAVNAKSLYRSGAGSHSYGTEYEIWAVSRAGWQEKKIGCKRKVPYSSEQKHVLVSDTPGLFN
jgi:hypothetical protein